MFVNQYIQQSLSLHAFCQRWETCDPLEAEVFFVLVPQIILKSTAR